MSTTTLIFPVFGQSNGVSNAPDGVTTQYSLSRVNVFCLDGFIRSLTEPVFDATNQSTKPIDHQLVDTPGQSSFGAMADRLRTLGETRDMIFLPCARGTTSAVLWNTGTSDSPPTYQNLYGQSRHMIMQAMKLPGAILGGCIINQGEYEAGAADSGVSANAWDTQWAAVFNALNTWVSGQGWTWAKSIHFWIDKLQNGSSLAFKDNVRTRQQALNDARSDTHIIQEPDASPSGLHLYAAQQISLGVSRANDWFAAT